jgi:hypothetical protein
LTASPNPITSSGTIGIASVITAGSCTNCNITYNAYGQVTVATNGSAGSGVTGSGAAPYFPIFTNSSGAAVVGNSNLQAVTSPNGVNYGLGTGLFWQLDATGLNWNSDIAGSGNILIQNSYAPGSSNNAGGIIVQGAPATGSACAGSAVLRGNGTNGSTNGASLTAGGGCSNGYGATAGDAYVTGASTSANNYGGNIHLQIGSGGFGPGTLYITGGGSPNLPNGCLNIAATAVGSFSCIPITAVATPLSISGTTLQCIGCTSGLGGTPTVLSAGSGAGSGAGTPSVLAGSLDGAGIISITTGTTPSASSTIVTLTYSTSFPNYSFCTISPVLTAAALATQSVQYVSTVSSQMSITSGVVPLTASSLYRWSYQCRGY